MSKFTQSFVLGYHGCDQGIADRALAGEIDIVESNQSYDWLGPGAYFWEGDPERALQFAHEQKGRGRYSHPTAIGAVIELGNCLNLSTVAGKSLIRSAYESLEKFQAAADQPMPANKQAKGSFNPDNVLRYLDNAVMRHLHEMIAFATEEEGSEIPPYDTVKCLFLEGDTVYPGAGFREKSHIQIAVRNPARIIGFFRLRPH